jgi:hypothetical protein
MIELSLIGVIYEAIILIPSSILVLLSFRNYIKNRRNLSLLLFLLLLSYHLSILFSWWSKIMSAFYVINYLRVDSVPSPKTPLSWFLLRISYFRFTFVFINLAILISFKFKKKIFNDDYSQAYNVSIYIFGLFNILFSIIFFIKGIVILDVIVFLLALFFESIVYVPFFTQSLKNFKLSSNSKFRNKFLNLMIMSISFILVLFCLLIDRVLIFLGFQGYTFFYFLSWIFVLFGIFTAYGAYLK